MTSPASSFAKPAARNRWYKNYILLIFVIAMPLIVVLLCIWFIIFAINNQDSTVRDDWYMDGKALYQDASKDAHAYQLGLAGIMYFKQNQVNFSLNYPQDSPYAQDFSNARAYPHRLIIQISHATDKDFDRDVILTHTQDNHYSGQLAPITPNAYYYVQITPDDGAWRLLHKQKLPASSVLFSPLPAFKEHQ